MIFAAIFIGFTAGILLLAAYTYLLYALGRLLAARPRWRLHPARVYAVILLISGSLAALGALPPIHIIYRFALATGLFLLHAHPTIVGFFFGVGAARAADRQLFERRAAEWLAEWERVGPER